MPTQTELEFYKAFGIEPDHYETCHLECKPDATLEDFKNSGCDKKDTCPHNKIENYYSEITDRRLLELICINNEYSGWWEDLIVPIKIETIKDKALKKLTERCGCTEIYHAVRRIMGVEDAR